MKNPAKRMDKSVHINRGFAPKGWVNRLHAHDRWEIVYYTKGKGTALLENAERPFVAGDLFVFPPNFLHGEKIEKDIHSWWAIFEGYPALPKRLTVLREPAHKPFFHLAEILFSEFQIHGPGEIVHTLLDAFVALILQNGNLGEDENLVADLKHVLIQNMTKSGFRIQEALLRTGLSETGAHKVFKKATGISPLQYLIDLRIQEGRRLLEITDLSVREIAGHSGFADPFHFSRAFRKKTGLSPAQFRESGKKSYPFLS
ncbi:MAG: helix-turn-helix domain-containing protein [Spirochaetia bacterium]|nr:helix-turn-helix domain-containing protein [Spirochaetia bacterium]